MHGFKFEISLRFFSKVIDPVEISTQLGLDPKWQHKIGEPRTTPKGTLLKGVYDISYCSFSFTSRKDEELHDMLDRIIRSLTPNRDLFSKIRDGGGRSEFFIGWYSPGNSGATLDFELLSKISQLRIDLALDVYGGQ